MFIIIVLINYACSTILLTMYNNIISVITQDCQLPKKIRGCNHIFHFKNDVGKNLNKNAIL